MGAIRFNIKKQPLLGGVLGALSGLVGVIISFRYDLPVGATISISSSLILLISILIATLRENYLRKKLITGIIKQKSSVEFY